MIYNNCQLILIIRDNLMFQRRNIEETEQMARKHGLAKNVRSNFKYLMKGKMNHSMKSMRYISEKQNRESSSILCSVNKYALPLKNNKIYQKNKETEITIPLNGSRNISNQYQKYEGQLSKQNITEPDDDDQIDFLKNFQKMSTERRNELKKSITNDMGKINNKKKDCISLTNENNINYLQKQKDDLQYNLSQIIKQNQTLKQIIANLTINVEVINKQLVETQTESVNKIDWEVQTKIVDKVEYEVQTKSVDKIEFETQTQMSYQNIFVLQNQLSKANECVRDTFQLCLSLGSQDEQFVNKKCYNLKDAVCQCINSKIISATNKFQKQRVILQELNKQLKQELKNVSVKSQKQKQQNLKQIQFINQIHKNQSEQFTIQIHTKQERCRAVQKQLNEKIEYFNQTIADNQRKYNKKILQLNNIRINERLNSDNEVRLLKQLMENSKQGWQEKQRLYSNLLLQAHKTINSLMIQMKQFQSQANQNYSKNLKVQRTLTGIQSGNNGLDVL